MTTSDSSPAKLTTATPHSVTLTWIASTTPNVTYNVYRGTQTLGPYTPIALRIGALTHEDTDVRAGVLYFYVVTAVDAANQESAYSNEATALVPQ